MTLWIAMDATPRENDHVRAIDRERRVVALEEDQVPEIAERERRHDVGEGGEHVARLSCVTCLSLGE